MYYICTIYIIYSIYNIYSTYTIDTTQKRVCSVNPVGVVCRYTRVVSTRRQ